MCGYIAISNRRGSSSSMLPIVTSGKLLDIPLEGRMADASGMLFGVNMLCGLLYTSR